MGVAVCTAARVPDREHQKAWSEAEEQTGSMDSDLLSMFAKGKNQWR